MWKKLCFFSLLVVILVLAGCKTTGKAFETTADSGCEAELEVANKVIQSYNERIYAVNSEYTPGYYPNFTSCGDLNDFYMWEEIQQNVLNLGVINFIDPESLDFEFFNETSLLTRAGLPDGFRLKRRLSNGTIVEYNGTRSYYSSSSGVFSSWMIEDVGSVLSVMTKTSPIRFLNWSKEFSCINTGGGAHYKIGRDPVPFTEAYEDVLEKVNDPSRWDTKPSICSHYPSLYWNTANWRMKYPFQGNDGVVSIFFGRDMINHSFFWSNDYTIPMIGNHYIKATAWGGEDRVFDDPDGLGLVGGSFALVESRFLSDHSLKFIFPFASTNSSSVPDEERPELESEIGKGWLAADEKFIFEWAFSDVDICGVDSVNFSLTGDLTYSQDIRCNFKVSSFIRDETSLAVNYQIVDSFGRPIDEFHDTLSGAGIEPVSFLEFLSEETINSNSSTLFCQINITSLSGENLCFGKSKPINDLDQDGYLTYSQQNGFIEEVDFLKIDCDDWPFDDHSSSVKGKCIIDPTVGLFSDHYEEVLNLSIKNMNSSSKEEYCYVDEDNDGVGDQASCSYCRNPGMSERCDDVDNNCLGRCQVSSGSIPNLCLISEYTGDGAEDLEDEIGIIGCIGLVNEYGVDDNFCQMVDDGIFVEGELCGGYSRCVRWTQLDTVWDSESGDIEGFKSKKIYSFKPGGVESKNPLQPFMIEGYHVPSYSNTKDAQCYIVEHKQKEIDGFTFKNRLLEYFGANHEDDAIRRGTYFESQFIDSMRGECYFDSFWDFMDSRGFVVEDKLLPVFEWNTSCVKRDKCDDYADNDGSEDLFTTHPYGYYVVSAEIDYEGEPIDFRPKMNVNLKDIDDPDCKFDFDLSPIGISYPLPKYDLIPYKVNPIKDEKYCLDNDFDGFCGCITKEEDGRIKCNYEATLKKHSISLQFPDCDDDPSDDLSQYEVSTGNKTYVPKLGPSYGWSEDYNEEITSWHVHPFSAITPSSCTFGFDMNCNKDYEEGWDISLLYKDQTPFDIDSGTGSENLFRGLTRPSNMDMICSLESPGSVFGKTLASRTVVTAGVAVGGALLLTGVGAMFGPTVVSGVAYGVMIIGAGTSGFEIGRGLSTTTISGESKNIEWDRVLLGSIGLTSCVIGGYEMGNPAFYIKPFATPGSKLNMVLTRKPSYMTDAQWKEYISSQKKQATGYLNFDFEDRREFLKETKPLIRDIEKHFDNIPEESYKIMYHYTSRESAEKILADEYFFPTMGFGQEGVYITDLTKPTRAFVELHGHLPAAYSSGNLVAIEMKLPKSLYHRTWKDTSLNTFAIKGSRNTGFNFKDLPISPRIIDVTIDNRIVPNTIFATKSIVGPYSKGMSASYVAFSSLKKVIDYSNKMILDSHIRIDDFDER
jgi:hypothetical protein